MKHPNLIRGRIYEIWDSDSRRLCRLRSLRKYDKQQPYNSIIADFTMLNPDPSGSYDMTLYMRLSDGQPLGLHLREIPPLEAVVYKTLYPPYPKVKSRSRRNYKGLPKPSNALHKVA